MNKFKDSLFWTNYKKFDKLKEMHQVMEDMKGLETSMRSPADAVIYWRLFQEYQFKDLLEIGTYQGMTAGLMLEASDNVSSYTGIDIELRLEIFNKVWKDYLDVVTLIQHSSLNFNFDRSKKYDFILVDGDHSYHGAVTDLMNAKDLLSMDGVLAIDDYRYPGVQQAIEELRATSGLAPFMRSDQTEFWHYPSFNRSSFLDKLFNDPIHNFIFVYNEYDREADGEIMRLMCPKALNQHVDFFDEVINRYDI